MFYNNTKITQVVATHLLRNTALKDEQISFDLVIISTTEILLCIDFHDCSHFLVLIKKFKNSDVFSYLKKPS